MGKTILKKFIQEKSGITLQEADIIFDVVINGISETLIKDGTITLLNFGSFKIKTVQSRMARNPKTGKPVSLPSRKVIRFRTAQKLKDRLLKG